MSGNRFTPRQVIDSTRHVTNRELIDQLAKDAKVAAERVVAAKKLTPAKIMARKRTLLSYSGKAFEHCSTFGEYSAGNQFLALGEAGDELGIQRFASQEKISEIVEEGVAYTFYWHNSRANESFFPFVRESDDGRLWTFSLLDNLWKQFCVSSSINRISAEPQPPTVEELDAMSDEEVERTLTEARRLRARNQIR